MKDFVKETLFFGNDISRVVVSIKHYIVCAILVLQFFASLKVQRKLEGWRHWEGNKFATKAAAFRVISCRQKASNSTGKMHYGNLHNSRFAFFFTLHSWPVRPVQTIVSCDFANYCVTNYTKRDARIKSHVWEDYANLTGEHCCRARDIGQTKVWAYK